MSVLPIDKALHGAKSFIYHVKKFFNASTIFLETSSLFIGKSYPLFYSVFVISIFSNFLYHVKHSPSLRTLLSGLKSDGFVSG